MRLVMLTGLLVCCATGNLGAADKDTARFLEVAKKLITAINSDDGAAIQATFGVQMQQALPVEKATPFFRKLVTAKGKLKDGEATEVQGATAVVRVTAERGAWDFKITLDAAGQIAGLLVTPAAAKAPTPAAADRFSTVANKLIQAINQDDAAAIQACFDAQMQTALPPDKATPFFRELLTMVGKLKKTGSPDVTGDTAVVQVTAERGALNFKISLDAADKISGLYVVPPEGGQPADSQAVPRSRTTMQLPFRGEWYVFWGGDKETVNYHVGVPGQRRAADLLIRGADNRSHKDTGRRNEDYYVYGKEILAAAAGTVVTAIDGVPDNKPGSMNPLCAVGNCLIIDQGSSEYAVYAHLKPGSLKAHSGDKVRQGEVLALCGNSGNSSEPHLHFHLQNSAVLQDGLGITPYFSQVKCRRGTASQTDAEYTFLQGDRIESVTKRK